jgi:putative membrane protein
VNPVVRTSVTILSFGFVVAKFNVWLREITNRNQAEMPSAHGITGMWMGVALMVLGGFLIVMAAWRYHAVNRNIELDKVKPDRSLVAMVTVVVVLMVAAMILFVFVTINHL